MKPEEIARFVNRELNAQRKTLYDLEAGSGVHYTGLSRWLNGRRGIRLEQLCRVLGALGCELDVLRSRANEKSRPRVKAARAAPRSNRKAVRGSRKRKAP
ncbi:MAG: helix-turn-helix domain-containing protein [Phycisphaerales bacterium]